MNDDRLPKTVLVGQPARVRRKAYCPRREWKVVNEDLREMGNFWEKRGL